MLLPLKSEGLIIEAADAPGNAKGIRLTWKGRCGPRNAPELLGPYFRTVLETAVDSGHATVSMHFEALEHFNSSTVAALIHLIQDARRLRVPLTFVYDQNLKWQKLSFDAMRVFLGSDGLLQMRSV